MKKIFLLVLLLATHASNASSFIERAYCLTFGNEDASAHYQNIIRDALRALHVSDAQSIPIKKMNSRIPALIDDSLYSFTMYGIWLNEELLAQCSQEERIFALTHEAVHYARGHHQRALLALTPTPLIVAALVQCGRAAGSNLVTKCIAGAGLTALGLYAYTKLVFQPFIQQQEKQADIEAARLLRSTQKEHVVNNYAAHIHNLVIHGHAEYSNGWTPTLAQQYSYLK